MSNMDKALAAFLIESTEGLSRMELDLVELEKNPSDQEKIKSVFRVIHTIKGTCGFFGYTNLEKLVHAAENLLAKLRDGQLHFNMEIISVLLDTIDEVRMALAHIEKNGKDIEAENGNLIQRLAALSEGSSDKKSETESKQMPAADEAAAAKQAEPSEKTIEQPKSGSQRAEAGDSGESENLEYNTTSDTGLSSATVRVHVNLLDKLMNQVGELVLARNQLLQYSAAHSDNQLSGSIQRLDMVTSELQEGLMKTRMQPISTVWSGYPRLIRDLEIQTGKKLKLDCQGGDTELDRSLLQAIKDPLTHLIRNAVDHGIESPAERAGNGKNEQGYILLRAFHESGNVIIEMIDDGKGIDTDSVLEKAMQKGLVRKSESEQMTDREIWPFLFMPGLSTAQEVTKISGRGVGLDVVKENIERVGGSIEVQSWRGQGTSFKMKIPLTLAIIQALITSCHHERFAIPQVNLMEIVRVDEEMEDGKRIEYIQGQPVFRLRGRLLPLVDLGQMLGYEKSMPVEKHKNVFILVLQADSQQYGLIVDMLHDTEEIVVKPLDRHLKGVSVFAGGTIMGDGHVALIMDVRAVAQYAEVLHKKEKNTFVPQNEDQQEQYSVDHDSLLLFSMDKGRSQGAIPLSSVSRLEKFRPEDIERSNGRKVVQYRGRILPLLNLGEMLDLKSMDDAEEIQVIVHASSSGDVGFVVDEIIDVVEGRVDEIQRREDSPGLIGSAVVQGKVTDFIDVDALIARGSRDLHGAPEHYSVE